MGWFDYVWLGVQAVFQGPELFAVFGIGISVTLVMILLGFLLGVAVGATPGLAGPMAMAISLPILISIYEDLPFWVEKELERQLESLPTADTARAALANGGVIVCESEEDACVACDDIAPAARLNCGSCAGSGSACVHCAATHCSIGSTRPAPE